LRAIGLKDYVPPAEDNRSSEIRALVPGRIRSILVKEGDLVQAGDPLLTLEAMKMQNQIVSPVSGHVKSNRVKEGDIVKRDSTLMIVS